MLEGKITPHRSAVMLGNAGAFHKDEEAVRTAFAGGTELRSELAKLGARLRENPADLRFDLQPDCIRPGLDLALALKTDMSGASLAGLGVLFDVPFGCDDRVLFPDVPHSKLRGRKSGRGDDGRRSRDSFPKLPTVSDLRPDIRDAYEGMVKAYLLSEGLTPGDLPYQQIRVITSLRARRVMTAILNHEATYPTFTGAMGQCTTDIGGVACDGVYAASFYGLARDTDAEKVYAILSSANTERVIPGKVMKGVQIARSDFGIAVEEGILRSVAMASKKD